MLRQNPTAAYQWCQTDIKAAFVHTGYHEFLPLVQGASTKFVTPVGAGGGQTWSVKCKLIVLSKEVGEGSNRQLRYRCYLATGTRYQIITIR